MAGYSIEERSRAIAALSLVEHMVGRRERAAAILDGGARRAADLSAPEASAARIELALNHWIGNDWTARAPRQRAERSRRRR